MNQYFGQSISVEEFFKISESRFLKNKKSESLIE